MTSPYTLPAGNVAIAFSGGRTSAYMLRQIIEANGLDAVNSERVVVSFQNTGREMPETLDFVQECGERWGVRIVWLEYIAERPWHTVVSHNSASRNGEPFEAMVLRKRMLPNRVLRFCTQQLKIGAAQHYLKSKGWTEWWACIGIRADERRRIKPHGSRISGTPQKTWQPLVEAGVSRQDVSRFWKRQAFDLMLPNVNGRTQLGNCDGCFLKSEAARAALAREYPERAQWWSDLEAKASREFNKPDGARFRADGSWAKMLSFIDRQGDWIFDTEDALCQANDGECTG